MGGGGGGGGGRYMLYKPHSTDVPNSHNFNNGNFAAKGRRPLTKEVAFLFAYMCNNRDEHWKNTN